MHRSIRTRAAVLLVGGVAAMGSTAAEMDMMWIAGYVINDQEMLDDATMGLRVAGLGATAAGALAASTFFTGVTIPFAGFLAFSSAMTGTLAG